MNTAPPRIGLYQPYPHTLGGLQSVVMSLARALPRFGFEPVILTPEEGRFTEKLRDEGLPYFVSDPGRAWHVYGRGARSLSYLFSVKRIFALLRYWWRLSRELQAGDIEVLHCNDYRGVLLAAPAARLAGIPVIWHMHGFVPSRLANFLAALLVDWTVPVSRGMLNYLTIPRRLFGPCRVICNGMETTGEAAFTPDATPVPVVLAVGTLHPRKGYEMLLRAFRDVVAQAPAAECWIVGGEFGDGSHGDELRQLAATLGLDQRVKFLGQSSEVPALMRRCTLLAVPSRIEAFGMVALEAMLAGKPVVACRTGGLQDIVVDGETGALVAPDDAVGMAVAILDLLRDPARLARFGEAGRAHAGEHFTLEKMAGAFADFYWELLGCSEEDDHSGSQRAFTPFSPALSPLPGDGARRASQETRPSLATITATPSSPNGARGEKRPEHSKFSAPHFGVASEGLPPAKTKVLHLITLSVVGGAQDNTFSTCELHDRDRYEVHLACNPAGQWIDRARNSCDAFHPLPTLFTPPHPWRDLRAWWDITALLRRERFDLVHTHTAKAGFLGRLACWLCRVPVVVHTYHAFPFHDYMSRWKRWLYLTLERAARPMTHFFITLSERDREDGTRLGLLRRPESEAVYTGINFDKLDRAAPRAATRAALGISEDTLIVMTAGRLEPQKAPHLLVEAFATVARQHPAALLLLAGDGELRPQVEATIARHGLRERVRILGFRDDVPDLLRAADVFAFSSLWEAMGRSMVEAMLMGRAVVVPAIYGIPEIVRHDDTGLLYEVGQVDQLAAGLSRLLGDAALRERLGINARHLTRRLFDARAMVARIENIFERTLAARSPRADILPFPQKPDAPLTAEAVGQT